MIRRGFIALLPILLFGWACDTGLDQVREIGIPEPPLLRTPHDLSTTEANAVSLTWEEVESALYYQVQVSDMPGFTQIQKEAGRVLNSFFDVRDLVLQQTYHWRVRAVNDAGVSDWSETHTFMPTVVARLPSRPELASPADKADNQETTIQFKWGEATGATSYQLEVSLDPTFNSTFASITDIRNPRQYVYGLVRAYTYFWRVRSYNPAGYSPWSNSRYIIIYGLGGEN